MNSSFKVERQPNHVIPFFNLILRCGTTFGMPYSHICQTEYKPTQQLTIQMQQKEIIISGNNLEQVHRAIIQQRLIEMTERNCSFQNSDSHPTLINSITINKI